MTAEPSDLAKWLNERWMDGFGEGMRFGLIVGLTVGAITGIATYIVLAVGL